MSRPLCHQNNMRLFIDALLSGKFRQGHRRLITIHEDDSETHCCLGVACEVAMRHGVALKRRVRVTPIHGFRQWEFEDMSWNGSAVCNGAVMPLAVMQWLGLDYRSDKDTCNPLLHGDGHLPPMSAAEWNDAQRVDFTLIASLFEHTYLQCPGALCPTLLASGDEQLAA